MSLAAEARAQDHERYLLALLQPAVAQPPLWALLCFASEIARIPELVSQEMVGLIRLAWWKERVADAYEGRESYPHEVVRALHRWIIETHPPRDWLEAMIEARQEQLGRPDIISMQAFEAFARATAGQLAALMSFACHPDATQAARAIDTGAAYGMLGLVRAAPTALAHGHLLLPELTVPYAVSPDATRQSAREVVARIRSRAISLVDAAPKDGISPLLAYLVRGWEVRIRGTKDDIFSSKLQESLPFLVFRLMVTKLLSKS